MTNEYKYSTSNTWAQARPNKKPAEYQKSNSCIVDLSSAFVEGPDGLWYSLRYGELGTNYSMERCSFTYPTLWTFIRTRLGLPVSLSVYLSESIIVQIDNRWQMYLLFGPQDHCEPTMNGIVIEKMRVKIWKAKTYSATMRRTYE